MALEQAKKEMKELLRLIPELVALIYRLLKDQRVPAADKAILAATLAYVFTPLDLMPDFVPFLGQVDDIYLIAIALLRLFNHCDEQVLRENWQGKQDIVKLIRTISQIAVFFLPKQVRETLLGRAR